jgi:hypothetical protein
MLYKWSVEPETSAVLVVLLGAQCVDQFFKPCGP